MKLHLFIFAFFIFSACSAQVNLVPNPSFEEYTRLPGNTGELSACVSSWKSPTKRGAGDYYHADAVSKQCGTAENYFGGEEPHSGKAYAGFCVTPEYREFLACRLKEPLIKGEQYMVSFFISNGDKASVSYLKEIGVLFLKSEITIPFGVPMNIPPQIVFYQDTGFTQHNGWQELSAIYTANGTEQWMYIGAHEWKCDTCVSIPGAARKENPSIYGGLLLKEAHYFVDDVSVCAMHSQVEVQVKDSAFFDTTTVQTETRIVFYDIHFKYNSAVLDTGAQPDLDIIVTYMMSHSDMMVKICGHTDSIGSEEYNNTLSLNRAVAVKAYLIDHGIAPTRILAAGCGEGDPIAPNSSGEGRAKNRRVEFTFRKTGFAPR